MKLWHSFIKELKLSSKSFYFYIEVGMAAIFLALLILVIPENFDSKSTEFIYLDLPVAEQDAILEGMLESDLDGKTEEKTIKSSGDKLKTTYYETESKKIHMTTTKEDLVQLAESEKKLGVVMSKEDDLIVNQYYLQGYESDKFINLYKVINNRMNVALNSDMDAQKVIALSESTEELTDRERVVPVFLTFNGSLMGLFIIAAYIFLDKKEGIVTAYAVTASSVWVYLMSKVMMLMVTSMITSLVIIIPIMGLQPNYLMIIVFLLASGFFSSSLGLVISSFYDNIMQAFGTIYILMIILILPNIAYFMPGWNPVWIQYIPSYYFLASFKEGIMSDGDSMYMLYSAGVLLAVGIILFVFANYRFKKTLTVSA